MLVAIYGRKLKTSVATDIQKLFTLLEAKNISYIIYEPFYKHLISSLKIDCQNATFLEKKDITQSVDFVFSLGGDGTILDAISWIGEREIPVMGINFGRLGFLASIASENIEEAIEALCNDTYAMEARSMIALSTNKPLFKESGFALNEFTVQRSETSSMITVHTYLNEQHLNSYWADGLIVSTPTGSTGYSLSCGGPIIYPDSKGFVITPVAPHNLNVRPMVVSEDVSIKLIVEGRSKSFLTTLDNRLETIDKTYELTLRKAPFVAKLVRLNRLNFINAIREKLHWGEDLRN